jgi:hypothetical protein
MKNKRSAIILIMSLLFAAPTYAQKGATVSRTMAGPIKVELGFGIVLNKESTLKREWITINHNGALATFDGNVGVGAVYKSEKVGGGYRYSASLTIEVKEPLSAVEVRFLLFDIWGQHTRTLSLTKIADLDTGKRGIEATWNLFSENEASEFYASIAYVAKVRTKGGRVIAADPAPVLEEARKFSSKFSAEDLEPKKSGQKEI